MTVLHRPVPPPPASSLASVVGRARALFLASVAGALAAVLSWMVTCVPVVVAWFADERSTVTLWQSLGVGVDLWALAHRGTVVAGDTDVVLAPLLLTAVPLLACRYAVNQVVVDRPEVRGDMGVISGWRGAWRALGGPELAWFMAGYVALGVLLCSLAGLGQAGVRVTSVVPGLLIVPGVAIALALAHEHRHQEQPTIDRGLRWVELHTPVLVRRGFRPAGEGLAGLFVVSLLLVVALLVGRAERIGALYATLEGGWVAVAIITLGQLLLLPNLLVWAAGWTTGADIAVGTLRVGWTETTGGDLPLVPVLAALPEPGPLPTGLWLVALVPVAVGAWLGGRSVRAAPRLASWWAKAQIAGSACLLVAAVMLVLSWLAVGGLTPGLLGQIGTAPLYAAGALLAELLVGALVTLTVLHLSRRRL